MTSGAPSSSNNSSSGSSSSVFGLDDDEVEKRLELVQRLVAQSAPESDPAPALIGDRLYVGSKYHAADVAQLVSLRVTGVLNCASGGIRALPLDEYEHNGIQYEFTNVAQDAHDYPILHGPDGVRSEHLEVAQAFYERVREAGGTALFFCVAGQNRSATLAVAVQLLCGQSLDRILSVCAEVRPFILENVGFQRQLVELEALQAWRRERGEPNGKRPRVQAGSGLGLTEVGGEGEPSIIVELSVPGLRTFDVRIPEESTIDAVKERIVERVSAHLRCCREAAGTVGSAWLVFSMFGSGPEFDLILEEAAVEAQVQVARLNSTFGLETVENRVRWTEWCRFELVLFSLKTDNGFHVPFTFKHQEREGAQGTLLAESNITSHLRAWDFVSGEAFRSTHPIVFSFSDDPKSKRDFMNISTSTGRKRQQFDAPGEGGILGMGNNAIVHHIHLEAARRSEALSVPPTLLRHQSRMLLEEAPTDRWDAAVKRPFSLAKMLASIESKNEAGVAKRLRMTGALNTQARLLYFYGLGIGLASNNSNHDEFKFEASLLSQYQEDFSSYTLKRFLEDYMTVTARSELPPEERGRIETLQAKFSLIKVKVLLVSLLNGFRDLTLMGVQAFDFNHLNNVLISRDYKKARLIDIDGASKGSIQFPSAYIEGLNHEDLHKPALDIDLSMLLPVVVQQLLLGKGRGRPFVNEKVSLVWRAKSDDDAKAIIRVVIRENFFSDDSGAAAGSDASPSRTSKHLSKVVEWFHACLMKRSPWHTWTNDIYDAMRCIDHLPIG